MLAASVAALIATLVLAAPLLVIVAVAVIALFSRSNTMSTAANARPAPAPSKDNKTEQSSGMRTEGKAQWERGEKEGERRGEVTNKESKRYAGEQRGSAGGTESPAPEPYTVSWQLSLTRHPDPIASHLLPVTHSVFGWNCSGSAHRSRYGRAISRSKDRAQRSGHLRR